jgi:quinol-cytochrome oxidoreductase complex cytochrome b subunit
MEKSVMLNHSSTSENDSIPFYPTHVKTEVKVSLVVLGIFLLIGIIGFLYPLGLGDPADPMNTPAHVKPEWYFLALYQLLKFVPKTAGVVVPVLLVGVIFLWPFIDRKPPPSPRLRKIRFVFVFISVIILIALTIWGEVS